MDLSIGFFTIFLLDNNIANLSYTLPRANMNGAVEVIAAIAFFLWLAVRAYKRKKVGSLIFWSAGLLFYIMMAILLLTE